MRARRGVLLLLILALTLAPAVGFAATDLSASPVGKHHAGRLHHQPDRGWRSVPSTLTPPPVVPDVMDAEAVSPVETMLAVPLVVRAPFIPPRG